jgi:2-amino-4-hydroxy-6-hydroxymethyldihydropteridine diphosphokinase
MAQAVIALGSNIEPELNLVEGIRLVGRQLRLSAASQVYQTPPWGYADQAPFLNAVVMAETELPPLELLEVLLGIEQERGRMRTRVNGPRTLDLDLLAYDDVRMESARLTLPHPRLHERAFVLVPLCDLLPEARHPGLGKTYRELLAALPLEKIELVELALAV